MSTARERRPLGYYLSLRYPVTVYSADEGGYVAEIPDLPGCVTQAETLPELFEMIEDARRGWITVTYEDGDEIPLPRTEEQFSGKFIVRAPASLHRSLALAAEQEGTSLNQYVVQLLARRVDLDHVLRRLDALGEALGKNAGTQLAPSTRIVKLADLLAEYRLESKARQVRSLLRSAFGRRQRPWQWKEDDPELGSVRAHIAERYLNLGSRNRRKSRSAA